MEVKLHINEDYTNIPILLNLNIGDHMDGTADTISFSFIFEEDVSNLLNLGQKIKLDFYKEGELFLTHHKVVMSYSVDKLSMFNVNGYEHTVLSQEHTVLLKNNIRTDLAITPALYPYDVYPTLREAVEKIIDCHNIPLFNEKIYSVDLGLTKALEAVACPVLAFTDLSTFDQLSDVLLRVGRVPYLENGKLYGLLLQGNRSNTELFNDILNLDEYSNISSTKQQGENYSMVSTKVYNNVYDNESLVIPSVFTDVLRENPSSVTFIDSQRPVLVLFSDDVKKEEQLNAYVSEQFDIWTSANYGELSDYFTESRLLSISGYSPQADDTYDPLSFKIELPTDIEYIESIYLVTPAVNRNDLMYTRNNVTKEVSIFTMSFNLVEVDKSYILEASEWNNLSGLHKRSTAYYVRGSSHISQAVSLIAEISDLEDTWVTSKGNLYKALKETFFAVKYKPMDTVSYTAYEYNRHHSTEPSCKPTLNTTLNLPYKQVSDKQASTILNYELQKKLDKSYSIKFITDNTDILKLEAGDVVEIEGKPLKISTMSIHIDNKSIEISMTLNDRIMYGNTISSYSDSVRVSTNLSTQTTVTRELPLYIENILHLGEYTETPNINRFEIPNLLLKKGLYDLGLRSKQIHNDTYLGLYHNVFIEPINPTADKAIIRFSPDTTLYSKTDKSKLYGDTLEVKFPITIKKLKGKGVGSVNIAYVYSDIGYIDHIDYNYTSTEEVTTITNKESLKAFLDNNSKYIFNYNINLVPIFGASILTWNFETYSFNDEIYTPRNIRYTRSGVPRIYPYNTHSSGVAFDNGKLYISIDEVSSFSNYMFTSSGNISKLTFKSNNPTTNFQTIMANLPKLSSEVTALLGLDFKEGENQLINITPEILSVDPLLYNASNKGSKITSIGFSKGVSYLKFKDLETLNENSKGLILDMNEIIQPFIQITTLPSKGGDVEITELNNNLEWVSESHNADALSDLRVYTIGKGESINSFTLNDDDKYITVEYVEPIEMKYILEFKEENPDNENELISATLVENNKYDYILVNGSVPLFKFRINNGEYTQLTLTSFISDSY